VLVEASILQFSRKFVRGVMVFDNNSGVNFREKEEVVFMDSEIGTLWTFHIKWKTKGDF
jgi:hypothetical protein